MRFTYAQEPKVLGRSWFRFFNSIPADNIAKTVRDIERYRATPKPARLINGEPTQVKRSWRERLSDWLNPLDRFVDIYRPEHELYDVSIKQARLYPVLRLFHRTEPALDKLAQANAAVPLGWSKPTEAFDPTLEASNWKKVAEAARTENRARAALLKPRIGTPR